MFYCCSRTTQGWRARASKKIFLVAGSRAWYDTIGYVRYSYYLRRVCKYYFYNTKYNTRKCMVGPHCTIRYSNRQFLNNFRSSANVVFCHHHKSSSIHYHIGSYMKYATASFHYFVSIRSDDVNINFW